MTEQNKHEIVYQAGGREVKLNPSIVQQFITKGNSKITMQEAVNFMQLCRYSELNPFLNEAYLIKYSNDRPADMVVSKDALMKRANREQTYNGYQAGIIVEDKEGELKYNKGQFYNKKKETLLGGWAKVFRKDIDYPFEIEVSLDEYTTYKSTWKKMPSNMIRKVALASALREAFPEQLGAMYTEDEPNASDYDELDDKDEVIEETENDLLKDFKKPDEEEKPKEEKKQTKQKPKKKAEKVEEVEEVKETKTERETDMQSKNGKEMIVDVEFEEMGDEFYGEQEDLFKGLGTESK